MKTVLTMIAVLALATVAQAGLVVEVDPGVGVGGGLTSYTVRLVADASEDMAAAFDGSFDGPMNQFKAAGILDTPSLTNADYLITTEKAQDSHFLLYDADLIPVELPNESPTQLAGIFSFNVSIRLENLALAQIVLAEGETVVLTGTAANAVGTKFDTNATIPEPATLALLGIGGLGVLIRRRRK